MHTFDKELAALQDLRLGVEMDKANLPDGDLKLRALDLAIHGFRAKTAAAYVAPDGRGGVEFGKGWMLSKTPQLQATMPLFAGPGDIVSIIDTGAICAAYYRKTGRSLDKADLSAAIIEAAPTFSAPVVAHPGEVLVALKRGDGYEDVHPQLVAEDAISSQWPSYRTIRPDGKD